jgi:hypothetical protein
MEERNLRKLNIAFFGTPHFAVYVLEEMKKAGIAPSLIVTAPEKPAGRGLLPGESPYSPHPPEVFPGEGLEGRHPAEHYGDAQRVQGFLGAQTTPLKFATLVHFFQEKASTRPRVSVPRFPETGRIPAWPATPQ